MSKKLTNHVGTPVPDNQNAVTAGPRGQMLLQDAWFLEKRAHNCTKADPAYGEGVVGILGISIGEVAE